MINLNQILTAMLASWRDNRKGNNNIIERPPAKHPKPHRDHPEWKFSKHERKRRERIRHLSRRKR